tara:strand:- start:1189 stop:1380 length:192 start_codon:yes stop_codon:yes gene_type:complete
MDKEEYRKAYMDLYKKRDREDERNVLRRAVESLHERILRNDKRINDLTDQLGKLREDVGKFIP